MKMSGTGSSEMATDTDVTQITTRKEIYQEIDVGLSYSSPVDFLKLMGILGV